MGDPSVLHEDDSVRQGEEDASDADLTSLRQLLLAPEQQQLAALQARLDDARARAEDLGEVLPQVLLQHAQDPHFTRALSPPIEKAITASVHRNPKPLADALFPVMGPAIRKAVSAALAGMIESLNRTLEHSLSWRSLQWRLEARRTGKSFAEVLLLKTLVYRVEQIFLIDRKSGLLLQHVHADAVDVQDADMVSGMLTAIKDFVQDSFRVADGDGLEAVKVGDLSVWIEAGPYAIVAAAIRGTAPREFRATLQDLVETIHLQFGEALESFNGDTSAFADARATLEGALEARYRAEEQRPRTRGAWLLASAVVIALLVLGGLLYRSHRRWTHYLDLVRAQPGLVVVGTGRDGGRRAVYGLRDPLARDPQSLLPEAGLSPDEVAGHWSPYYALDPALVLARVTTTLRPPAGTTLTLTDGVLAATGDPPAAWVREAARQAAFVPGVARFDLAASLQPSIRRTIAAVEGRPLRFVKGHADLTAADAGGLASLVSDVQELSALAADAGVRVRVDVVGHTDAEGPDEANVPLSAARAESIAAAIRAAAGPALDVTTRGVGSAEPIEAGQNETSNQQNRRVTIHVAPVEAAARTDR
jgi:OOP family OmpA-OmpF porin